MAAVVDEVARGGSDRLAVFVGALGVPAGHAVAAQAELAGARGLHGRRLGLDGAMGLAPGVRSDPRGGLHAHPRPARPHACRLFRRLVPCEPFPGRQAASGGWCPCRRRPVRAMNAAVTATPQTSHGAFVMPGQGMPGASHQQVTGISVANGTVTAAGATSSTTPVTTSARWRPRPARRRTTPARPRRDLKQTVQCSMKLTELGLVSQ